ncbi:SnoaL-like domain-containing protein [Ferruginibacter sp.]
MTTQQVADRFYELSQQNGYEHIQTELYSDNARSIEPDNPMFSNAEGIEAIREKGKQFSEMIEEVHGGYCNKPQVAGNFFTCTMGMDVTIKGQPRMQMDEVAVYEVKDGKIVLEQFFF